MAEVSRYAIVDKNNNVVNVTLWDGETPWQPGKGIKAIKDKKNEAQASGKWDGKKFIPPK